MILRSRLLRALHDLTNNERSLWRGIYNIYIKSASCGSQGRAHGIQRYYRMPHFPVFGRHTAQGSRKGYSSLQTGQRVQGIKDRVVYQLPGIHHRPQISQHISYVLIDTSRPGLKESVSLFKISGNLGSNGPSEIPPSSRYEGSRQAMLTS